MPLASEIDIEDRSIEPLMISTTRGTFLESRISRAGYARFGFSECRVEQEEVLVREFHRALVSRAKTNGWPCASTVGEAVDLMARKGARPCHLAAGPWVASAGDGVKVLEAGFSQGTALLVAEPSTAGLQTRVGDYVGVLAYRVDRCFVAVAP